MWNSVLGHSPRVAGPDTQGRFRVQSFYCSRPETWSRTVVKVFVTYIGITPKLYRLIVGMGLTVEPEASVDLSLGHTGRVTLQTLRHDVSKGPWVTFLTQSEIRTWVLERPCTYRRGDRRRVTTGTVVDCRRWVTVRLW